MSFIYLNKLTVDERIRVDPDEIRMIERMDDGSGSIVTFKNDDEMRFREAPSEIESKEWRLRYIWPNLERLLTAALGGVIGSLLTLLMKVAPW